MRTQSPVPEDVGENTVWELSLGNDVRTRWVICEPRSPKWQRPLASLDSFSVGVIDFFELHTDTSFCKFSVFGNDLVRMKFCACYSQAYGFITF